MEKKILFIGSSKSDYLQDLTYSGLVSLLGKNRLVEYQWNYKYHLPIRKYPKNLGYVKNSTFQRNIYKKDFSDIELILIASCKSQCFDDYISILESLPAGIPTIFIDGGDHEKIGGDLEQSGKIDLYKEVFSRFDLIFKREYSLTDTYKPHVFPLQFSFNFNNSISKPTVSKYDVAFWAVESHPIRTRVLELIEDKFDCASNGSVKDQKYKSYKRKGRNYLQELSASKICLNFRGSGWDTMRYWETPAVGTLMITQRPSIYIPDNFEHEKHVIFCNDDLSDLLPLCAYYLKNESRRLEIAGNGFKFASVMHTHIRRAAYILKVISSELGIDLFKS